MDETYWTDSGRLNLKGDVLIGFSSSQESRAGEAHIGNSTDLAVFGTIDRRPCESNLKILKSKINAHVPQRLAFTYSHMH